MASIPNGTIPSTSRRSPFAQAILGFVAEEIKRSDDKKSRFSTEVLAVANKLNASKKSFHDSSLSATALMKCISELEESQRKRSKIRRISTRLKPLVQGLSQYISVIDTMIQADPTPGALIYGGAKLVLQLAGGFSDYFEKVVDMLEEIGYRLELFNIYSQVYDWSDLMNDVLVRSFKSILEFWKKAAELFSRKCIKIFFRGFFKPFAAEYSDMLATLDKDIQHVRDVAQAAQAIASRKFEKAQVIASQNLEIAQVDEQKARYREKVIDWLDAADAGADYEKHQLLRHPGTCEWLLNHESFTAWKKAQNNKALWLHAVPGAGKSVLCSRVIEELQSLGLNVVYFYFAFDDPAKNRSISMLRSLIVQLLALFEHIPDEFCEIQKTQRMDAGQRTLGNVKVAIALVGVLLKRIPRIHVVIDGLDECLGRGDLLGVLGVLLRLDSHGIVKWFFASRDEVDIRNSLTLASVPEITVGDATQSDIMKFLEEDPFFEEDTLSDKEDDPNYIMLSSLSNGNFLWVRLTLEVLRGEGMTCEEDQEHALTNFYPGLTSCYLRTLQQLATRKSSYEQELVRKIFMFVTLARQPLTFNEISEALAVRVGTHEPSGRKTYRADVIEDLCRPLIELDRTKSTTNPTLRLVHKTVGEFLKGNPETLDVPKDCWKFFITESVASLDIGRICLTYLSYTRYINPEDLVTALERKPLKEHAFLKYAAIFWHWHLSQTNGTRALFDEVACFLRSCNFWTCIQVQSIYAPYLFARLTRMVGDNFQMSGPDDVSGLECSDYYSDALPGWLTDFGNEGKFLVQAYQLFVKEWGLVLIRHPGEIKKCYSATLGRNNFLSMHEWWPKDKIAFPLEHSYGYASTNVSDEALCGGDTPQATSIVSFHQLKAGLHATVATFRPSSESSLVTLQHWLLSIDGVVTLLLEKMAEFPVSDLPQSVIGRDLNNPELPVVSRQIVHPVINTAIQPGVLSIGENPSDLYHISRDTAQISKINSVAKKLMTRKGNNWVLRSRVLTSQDSKIALALRVSSAEAQGSSFIDSDYGTDDSEDEELINMNFIALFNGESDNSPLWFEFEGDTSILRQSPPTFHPTKPLIVWPLTESTFIFINYTTCKTEVVNGAASKYLSEKPSVAREVQFSSSGTQIHEATIKIEKSEGVVTWTIERTTSDFSIENDNPSTAKVTCSSFSSEKVSWSAGYLGSYDNANSPDLPCSLTWTENHLYAVFRACETIVFRFPLPQSGMTQGFHWDPTVEILREPMFLPASVDKRGVRFFPHTVNGTDYGIFALGGTAELAPVLFVRDINSDLGGWEKYDGKVTKILNAERGDGYMKGIYAAGESDFCVPIRSSLAWQKRSYVTCY